MTPDNIEGFIWGCLAGLLVGCAVGSAGMYALHLQSVSEYTNRILNEMRDTWQR